MTLKYVILNDGIPTVFTEAQPHESVCLQNRFAVTSAGFCELSIKDGELSVSCWGKSIGLNVESIPDHDEKVIKKMFSK